VLWGAYCHALGRSRHLDVGSTRWEKALDGNRRGLLMRSRELRILSTLTHTTTINDSLEVVKYVKRTHETLTRCKGFAHKSTERVVKRVSHKQCLDIG